MQLMKDITNEEYIEAAVIATFVDQPELVSDYSQDIKPDWFSDDMLRAFWRGIVEITTRSPSASKFVIVERVLSEFPTTKVGDFLIGFQNLIVPKASLTSLIEELREINLRRELAHLSNDFSAIVQTRDHSADEITKMVTAKLRSSRFDGKPDLAINSFFDQKVGFWSSLVQSDNSNAIPTGIASLDNKIDGFKKGQLYVVAGRPGMGKTAFALSALRQCASQGSGVGLFSLELTEKEIVARTFSDLSYRNESLKGENGIEYKALLDGCKTCRSLDLIEWLETNVNGLSLLWDARPSLSMLDIRRQAERMRTRLEGHGTSLDVVCIDHIGLVNASKVYKGNKVQEISQIANDARILAKEMNCCVVLISQLSRGVETRENKRPQLTDLQWSGELEQHAHLVAFLYSDYYYVEQGFKTNSSSLVKQHKTLELIIRKNRNGPKGVVKLHYSMKHSAVRDLF